MYCKYTGNKKSIEARSSDGGKTWDVQFFDQGRLTEYPKSTLASIEAMAKAAGMRPAETRR